eukprot:gnl/MRDRNA2_/MRDRNA2_59114_c0_seq1.p1 gnl/MRDRNA2_/MRDRNA2_59114_c0~~gnl/MRDRNA2_/MRDRNA2_59114_c0_seq1.p1  ORF type:complete len:488 (-),score=145.83 gnl/MRDRNA2_/MRDRNA2_59114_c0_seq1:46-1509(-)
MANQTLMLLSVIVTNGLVNVTASSPEDVDLSLMQKAATLDPVLGKELSLLGFNDADLSRVRRHDDHDDHHENHMKAMAALKVACGEIDAAIAMVGNHSQEEAAIGKLETAKSKLEEVLTLEESEAGHGSEDSHEGHEEHEHTHEKVKHALEHLVHAIGDLKAHKEHEGANHTEDEHTECAMKDLKLVKEEVEHARAAGLRACATGEVEHAMVDILKAMVGVLTSNANATAGGIAHAKKCLECAVADLKELSTEEHKFEQDTHALEDLTHALGDLAHAAGDLKEHTEPGHKHTGKDTECMIKDFKHALGDLKCAFDDLHTAHSLSDLHCALHDLEHLKDHKLAKKKAHVAECIAHDVIHGATMAVKSKHLYKSYGARLVKYATSLKKKPTLKKTPVWLKSTLSKSIKVIKERCHKHHETKMKKECYFKCEVAHQKCEKTPECWPLPTYAKNYKQCNAVRKTCGGKCKVCKKKCSTLKHEHEETEGHDH